MRPEKAEEEVEVCADDGDDLFKALGKKLSACHNKGLPTLFPLYEIRHTFDFNA